MEFADTLFGVTMEKKGVSKLVSVNLTHPSEVLAAPN
jgi:chromosome segregation ATPase